MVLSLPPRAAARVGTAQCSRRTSETLGLGCHRFIRTRMAVVCMGRNDGASGKRRRRSNRTRRSEDFEGPSMEDGPWYDLGAEPATRGSPGGSDAASRTLSQPSTSGMRLADAVRPRGGPRQKGRRQSREDSDDEEDTRGWWERPEERSLQAYAAVELEPWQEERLQRAYAAGRRKAQIQDLARELDVDRSTVLAWFKEFSLKPPSEREAILTPLRAEAEAEAKRQRAAQKEAAGAAASTSGKSAPAAAEGAGPGPGAAAAKSSQGPEQPSGFVPFYLRKQLGLDKQHQRRLKGEVLRTLESIYDRTPFPSGEVIRGLFELHRLPKEVATEWFAARRAADGISSSTQKRAGRTSLREKDRDLEGAFSGGPGEDGDGYDDGSGLDSAPDGVHLRQTRSRTSAQPQPPQPPQPQQQPAEPTEPVVVTLSRREMAALRSSLPSPTKHKGRTMAEKMGVKTGPGEAATQIGNVQYVEAVPAAPAGDRVRASWRFRASSGPSTAGGGGGSGGGGSATAAGGRRLRLRGRPTGRGVGGDGRAGGVFLDDEEDE